MEWPRGVCWAARQEAKRTEFSVITDLPTTLRTQRPDPLRECRVMRRDAGKQARVMQKQLVIACCGFCTRLAIFLHCSNIFSPLSKKPFSRVGRWQAPLCVSWLFSFNPTAALFFSFLFLSVLLLLHASCKSCCWWVTRETGHRYHQLPDFTLTQGGQEQEEKMKNV